ncbi:TPA: hypothetical protein DCX16_05135, partial [bacterium]|nr:hypothetical protein [bacterium]
MIYEARFIKDKEGLSLNRILLDNAYGTTSVDLNEINQLRKLAQDFRWNQYYDLSEEIGKQLFELLNGDSETLSRAIKEADDYNKTLQVIVMTEELTTNLPFELLYYDNFLVPSRRIHLTRQVSDRGIKSEPKPAARPLRILFMVCSPSDISPVLEFEKEEEAILEATKDLPVEIDVEDTGSLEGLGELLATNEYDIIHLTGHADIDNNGKPFFWMEDEEGLGVKVKPQELWEKLKLNLPRLIFLSGCRSGEVSGYFATISFAHSLVLGHVSVALGWGLPVSNEAARFASEKLYFEPLFSNK